MSNTDDLKYCVCIDVPLIVCFHNINSITFVVLFHVWYFNFLHYTDGSWICCWYK